LNSLIIPVSYGAAVVFVCGLSGVATWKGPRSARNAAPISALLFLTWLASNACHALPREFRSAPYPYIDTIGATLCIILWYADGTDVSFWPRAWELALAFSFLTETILHAVTPEPWQQPFNVRYSYDLSLNLVFIVQLLLGSTPGAIYVGTHISSLMRHRLARGRIRSAVAR
jgi:hypothetical protein